MDVKGVVKHHALTYVTLVVLEIVVAIVLANVHPGVHILVDMFAHLHVLENVQQVVN